MSAVTITGTIHHEPDFMSVGDEGNFDLKWSGTLSQVMKLGPLTLSGTYTIAGPLPAKVISIRLVSGGPVTLTLSGPGGSNQTMQVTEEALLVSVTAPFTSVALSGSAVVEVFVGA